jgi:uncharacterized LabA/DUF88 family protein
LLTSLFFRVQPRKSYNKLDFKRLCHKLAQDRDIARIDYFVGKLSAAAPGYGAQRSFAAHMEHAGINMVWGRVERRPGKGPIDEQIKGLLTWTQQHLKPLLDLPIYNMLREKITALHSSDIWVEKAVDVQMAVSMVEGALSDSYDVAYVLSADGDFTPAVKLILEQGKKVFVASFQSGAKLQEVVNTFIRLRADFLDDCCAST